MVFGFVMPVVLSESTILMIVFVDYDLSQFYKFYKILL